MSNEIGGYKSSLIIATSDYSSVCAPCFFPLALLSDEGRADVCGRKASHFFSMAESLRSPLADPFIWVFIRPPWSPTGSCCKAVVFDRLKAECDNNVVGFSHCHSKGNANVVPFFITEHSRKLLMKTRGKWNKMADSYYPLTI